MAKHTSNGRHRKVAPRRSRADMAEIREAIRAALVDDHPMTVRQVYYRLVSNGAIDKTEGEYNSTVVRLLTVMRRSGEIPYGWIADSTRWKRKPKTYSSMERMLWLTAQTYRRAIWDDQACYVEVWLEKEALAGVLVPETRQWDVPLMVTRGYPSLSFLYESAESIKAEAKPTHLYYFGDYDPSGVHITKTVEQGIREFAPEVKIHFERVAVTLEQIEEWELPTRPTKKTDSRSKGFQGESVEVDAIAPSKLREMVRSCIERHVDKGVLERTREIEQAERQTLFAMAADHDEDD